MANLIDQSTLEDRLGGPTNLLQYVDDDGDGVADPAIVSRILDEASCLAEGLLWAGFPNLQQIATLVVNDSSVRGAVADIACGLCGDRRRQLVTEGGKAAQDGRRAQGERVLREVAKAARRAPGEAVAGTNTQLQNRVSREKPPTTFIFADTAADRAAGGRGPGGF